MTYIIVRSYPRSAQCIIENSNRPVISGFFTPSLVTPAPSINIDFGARYRWPMQVIKAARGLVTKLCPSIGDACQANPIRAIIIHWLDKSSPARKGNPTQRGDCTALVLPMQNSAQGPTRIRIDGRTTGRPDPFPLLFII